MTSFSPPVPMSLPRDVSLATQLTRNIRLNLPWSLPPLDTVTEASPAITWPRKVVSASFRQESHPRQQA